MTDKKEDNRDIFEKIFDESGVAIPVALMVTGGAIGRRLGRNAAKKEYAERLHGIKPGDKIIDDAGNTRRATKLDAADFERQFRGKVRSGGWVGGLAGATVGNIAGMPIVAGGMHEKKRKK